jgi:hypothetical protein
MVKSDEGIREDTRAFGKRALLEIEKGNLQ